MLDIVLSFLQDFMDYAAKKEGKERPKIQQAYSEQEFQTQLLKNHADDYVEAELQIEQETDPIRKRKMQKRLAFGVTDFSDI